MNSPVEVQKHPCLGNQVPVTSPCSPQSRGWPLKTSPPPPLRKRARMSQRKCRPGCLLQPSLSSDADTSMGSGSEIDGGDEDKEIASRAVALVIRSSRKGVVPLCADVANLLKIKGRLERTIKAQQLEIHRLLSMSRTHCSQSSASTQTYSSGPGSPVPSSSDRSASQAAELIRCEEQQQFELRVSPRQSDQEALVQCVSPPQNVESLQKPVPGHEFTVSRGEVQVECPQLLMQKRCEQELMETLLLDSRLTEGLGGVWNQIEHLRDRLRQSETQEPQETLSMENVYHGQGTRSREDSKLPDREPIPTACRCANQDTVLTNYREDGHSGQQTNRTDKGTLRKHSVSCTLPTKEGQLQSTSHVDTPKARSLGCGIGYGYLHRIPSLPVVPKQKVEIPPPPVASTPPQNLEKGYTEAPLIAPNSPIVGTSECPDLEQGLTNLTMESSLLPPPPIQRVMDPGFPPGSTDIPEARDLSDVLKVAVTSHSSPIFNTITERNTGTNGVLISEELDLHSDHTIGGVPEDLNSVSAELCAAASMEQGLDPESSSMSDLTVPSLPTSAETQVDADCTESEPADLVECLPQGQDETCDISVTEEEA